MPHFLKVFKIKRTMYYFVLIASLSLSPPSVINAEKEIWISGPVIDDWGTWGNKEFCPNQKFVNALSVRVEGVQGNNDDTSLNSVVFHCSPIDQPTLAQPSDDWRNSGLLRKNYITSVGGVLGDWKNWETCPNGSIAIGYNLKVEEPQGDNGDNTAANDLKLLCEGVGKDEYWIGGNQGGPYGEWVGEQRCDEGSAICGIRTRVQPDQGYWQDDSGLVDLEVRCCPLTPLAASCPPSEAYEVIFQANSSQLKESQGKIQVPITIGISRSEEAVNLEDALTRNLPFVSILHRQFSESAPLGNSLNFNWQAEHPLVWLDKLQTFNLGTWANPECSVIVEQLKGHCGPYTVHTDERRVVATGCSG